MYRMEWARIARKFRTALFVMAIPIFLITSSVTWAVNDLRLWRYGFDTYGVSEATGIDNDGLMAASRQIRGYFNSTREPLHVTARVYGEETELFNDREVVHMKDVKHLIWGVYGIGAASATYLLGFLVVGTFALRRQFIPGLSRGLMWGSGLTLALVALVGIMSLVGFESLFQFFHQVSFSNDLWMLDPNKDFLLMIFPQGFWFRSTLFVALATIGEALALGGIAWSLVAFHRRHERMTEAPIVQQPSKAAEH